MLALAIGTVGTIAAGFSARSALTTTMSLRTSSCGLAAATTYLLIAVMWTVSDYPRGVTAESALVPFLRRHFPVDRIRGASARWTRPTEIEGWGYRWNPGLSSISLREGDALWLTTSGSQFVITIDDADSAAQLTKQLLALGRKGR
ncbi:hypothetical protein [Streptomyces cellulosae]|uniref:hypothetical protein n=1 Tax=Streptomyces cellulosae TaxID=1968 RepID=UPI0004CA1B85|nr:hypothetical protein [Streptomyces cellulosae]